MSYVVRAKAIVKALGLQGPAAGAVRTYARMFPHQICSRDGIKYDLDLSEVIDFSIFSGGWEPGTLGFLKENVKPGDVVIEVGANVGAHTLALADLVGPSGAVYAFEPTEYASRKLRRNIQLNPRLGDAIHVRNELVTNAQRDTPNRTIKSSWKTQPAQNVAPERLTCASVSIDEFASEERLARLNLLKIDVDGYDYKVLQGASASLEKFRPLVFVELCEYTLTAQGDSIRDIFQLLNRMGYKARYEHGGLIDGADEVLRVVGMNTSMNAVFTAA